MLPWHVHLGWDPPALSSLLEVLAIGPNISFLWHILIRVNIKNIFFTRWILEGIFS